MRVHEESDSILKNPQGHELLSQGGSIFTNHVREARVSRPI